MVNETVERFKNEKLLPKKTADGLKVSNPKTPKFYISPKIHEPNNPGRPVINSVERETLEISRFVDHHFQPVVKQIPSYIKDTNHFIFMAEFEQRHIYRLTKTNQFFSYAVLMISLWYGPNLKNSSKIL